jgi:ketosteroid isomerase-like protein
MNGRSLVKRLKGFVLLAVGAIALLHSVSPAGAAMDATLAKLDEDWSKAAQTKDPDKIAAFYSDHAVVYPPNGPIAVGKAAAREVWAGAFRDSSYTIRWKPERAEVGKGGDMGFTSGTYESTITGADKKISREKGKYLCVWKKQADGNWKAAHDMWNADAK